MDRNGSGHPSEDSPPSAGDGTTLAGRHMMVGRARLHRVGWWGFPVYELRQGEERVAAMGRSGWFRIYMGRGQRIELSDGTRWRLRSVAAGGDIRPLVVDDAGRKVAVASAVHGTYGINVKDAAYVLFAGGAGRLGRRMWTLRHFEDEVATVTPAPWAIDAALPVPLGAVLLSFVLARYGLPSDAAPRVPAFSWG